MIIYLESSALLRWLLGASGASRVTKVLKRADRVVTSRLTLGECRRVLVRGVADGTLRPHEGPRLRARLDRAAAHWTIFDLDEDIWMRAESAFPVEPVRTLDAIHLATALRFDQILGGVRLLSTDDRVVGNWTAMGLPVA